MKFCYACGRTTGGKPLFCNFCGRSYDVKLCPRLHENPRMAEACSRCGNRNLSIPQPRVPLLWRVLAIILFIVPGALLFLVSLGVIAGIPAALAHGMPAASSLEPPIVIVSLLWGLWGTLLPYALRVAIHRLLRMRRNSSRT